MGSDKWGYKSRTMGYKYIVTLLITLLITTHEPQSKLKTSFSGMPSSCLI